MQNIWAERLQFAMVLVSMAVFVWKLVSALLPLLVVLIFPFDAVGLGGDGDDDVRDPDGFVNATVLHD